MIGTTSEEDPKFGGLGDQVRGILDRVTLLSLESGTQQLASGLLGMSVDSRSSRHEYLGQSSLLEKYKTDMSDVKREYDALMNILQREYPDYDRTDNDAKKKLMSMFDNWKPGCNENHLPFTPLLAVILGVDLSKFTNAIPHPPSNDPRHCYNSSLYNDTNKLDGQERIETKIQDIETNGGISIFTENEVCFGRTSLVDIILHRDTGWNLVHSFWDVYVLKQQKEENVVRLIIVHRSWCWMVGFGKAPVDYHYKKMLRRAKEFMVLCCFSNGFPGECGTETVVANPLFAWHFWKYLLKNVHVDIFAATLVFKNLITKLTVYAFNSRYHSLQPAEI
jgi:hypothetical protein